mmetsp:Transcript_17618/g.24847  ORF Transcript_17618/g.24847 Transcript_17618/m.24847 type:complete len:698 (-) Transcript_17618:36-2129(-)
MAKPSDHNKRKSKKKESHTPGRKTKTDKYDGRNDGGLYLFDREALFAKEKMYIDEKNRDGVDMLLSARRSNNVDVYTSVPQHAKGSVRDRSTARIGEIIQRDEEFGEDEDEDEDSDMDYSSEEYEGKSTDESDSSGDEAYEQVFMDDEEMTDDDECPNPRGGIHDNRRRRKGRKFKSAGPEIELIRERRQKRCLYITCFFLVAALVYKSTDPLSGINRVFGSEEQSDAIIQIENKGNTDDGKNSNSYYENELKLHPEEDNLGLASPGYADEFDAFVENSSVENKEVPATSINEQKELFGEYNFHADNSEGGDAFNDPMQQNQSQNEPKIEDELFGNQASMYIPRPGEEGDENTTGIQDQNSFKSKEMNHIDEEGKKYGQSKPTIVESKENVNQKEQPQHKNENMSKFGKLISKIESHFADVSLPFNPKTDLPILWHIPKSGGTSMQDIFGNCIGLVQADEVGVTNGHGSDKSLKVVTIAGAKYVNVDVTTTAGIKRAIDMNFAASGLADVVVTGHLDEVSNIFEPPKNLGKCFTLMRHPVKRAISIFYYLQWASWESTYHAKWQNITIDQYAQSSEAESNWMVRMLNQKLTGPLDRSDVERAKDILKQKCLIGMLEDFDNSLNRFESFFGWRIGIDQKEKMKCQEHVLKNKDNSHPHEKYEPGSYVWELLKARNLYDIELFSFAGQLYREQESLIKL